MKSHLTNRNDRSGFTLVELLVSISIFVILLTIAIGAIDLSSGNRGLSSGANQLQSAIEGARSRAAKLQRNVGLRFILNDRIDNTATSNEVANTSYIEYVAALEPTLCSVEVFDDDIADPSNPYRVELGFPLNDAQVLGQLISSGAFTRSAKIQLYLPDANNPTIVDTDLGTYSFTPTSTPSSTMYINPPLKVNDTLVGVPNAPAPNNVLRLFARITFDGLLPLPNESPIQLAKDVVIDWKSSKPPREWEKLITINTAWQPLTPYEKGASIYENNRYFICLDRGISGTSANEPNWAAVAENGSVADATVRWRAFQQPSFELVFNPRGNIQGSIVSNGIIHFVLASKDDVLKGRNLFGDGGATGQTDNELNFEREHRILTIFTQTGFTSISPANLVDANNDNSADDPYRYALEGVEVK